MNDKDDSGSVSVEEAMQILYLRFGKGLLDSVRPHSCCAFRMWNCSTFLQRETQMTLLSKTTVS